MKIKFIYALKNPETNEVFYVGMSVDPSNRFLKHLSESNKSKFPKDAIISEIISKGKMPILEILEEVRLDSKQQKNDTLTCEREKYWIQFYAQSVSLSNMQNNVSALETNKICAYCDTPFYSFSKRTKFCSDVCRVYYSRKKAKKISEIEKDPMWEEFLKWKKEKDNKPDEVVSEKWYDAKAMQLHQDFEKKQHEKLPPEFHQSFDRVITNVKKKMAENGEYDFTGVKYLNVEQFTKFPESSRPKTMGEAIDWQKKRDADVANIKTAWNNWKKQTF